VGWRTEVVFDDQFDVDATFSNSLQRNA
jgi:hypothetical protein